MPAPASVRTLSLTIAYLHHCSPPGFTREWLAFSEGVQEVIDARVYSGIHFRTADVTGASLGRQVARFVLNHALGRVQRP